VPVEAVTRSDFCFWGNPHRHAGLNHRHAVSNNASGLKRDASSEQQSK
jgi:hypothetical protein